MQTDTLVATMRAVGADLHLVEVKAAARGLPTDVVETLSAFANGDGGTLLLGLDEQAGFAPAAGFDAVKIRDALAGACADKMSPPLRIPIEIEEFEGALVVRADVPELDPLAKPCFVETRGAYQGSFIRGGDGDRRLTQYEVTQLLANRTQPTHDIEVVARAGVDDLDRSLADELLNRSRRRSPRAFENLDDVDALTRLGALARDDGQVSCAHPRRPIVSRDVSTAVLPAAVRLVRGASRAPHGPAVTRRGPVRRQPDHHRADPRHGERRRRRIDTKHARGGGHSRSLPRRSVRLPARCRPGTDRQRPDASRLQLRGVRRPGADRAVPGSTRGDEPRRPLRRGLRRHARLRRPRQQLTQPRACGDPRRPAAARHAR